MKEHGISLYSESESSVYFKGGTAKEHLFHQPTGTSEVGRSDRRSEETDTSTRSCIGQHPVISPADSNTPSSLTVTTFRTLLVAVWKRENTRRLTSAIRHDDDVLTHPWSVPGVACDLRNNNATILLLKQTAQRGSISNNVDASLEMKVNSVKEPG